jgi:hypothetical protein
VKTVYELLKTMLFLIDKIELNAVGENPQSKKNQGENRKVIVYTNLSKQQCKKKNPLK